MFFNERKTRILEAIINDYIATAEPIGSRTIAKKYDLGISSATIRNEMSDLEEMGYIVQPHTSAGRVPSDKGYRLYVDKLMPRRELTPEETAYLHSIIAGNISHVENLMRETAKAISVLTNYTTIASEPASNLTSIKHIQLLPMDESNIAIIIVTERNAIKNHMLPLDDVPDYETLTKLSFVLNDLLESNKLSDITKIEIEGLYKGSNILQKILDYIKQIMAQEDGVRVYTSGVKNILEYPEFSDIEKAKGIFKTFEEQEMLITLLGNNNENVQVVIGSENTLEQMKGCSIIKANYTYGKRDLGSIGIIGPTRMDYSQVFGVLNGIVKNINAVLYSITKET
ncbi:MAG: heat-inducible transcriptional repressor HrcA [Defluviitaleaceae bacterium]|nr:heat-inducible transcriptional repressor HrcA [Defluviitaleaceae bacterium]